MVRTIERERGADLNEAMQQMYDLHPELWGRLMAHRAQTKQHILILVNGDTLDVVPAETQPLPMESIKRLEPGQVIVEVSSLDDAPDVRPLKMAGDAHWQLKESALERRPARTIPLDEKRVLVLDSSEGPETGSQVRPEVDEWDGIDAAA